MAVQGIIFDMDDTLYHAPEASDRAWQNAGWAAIQKYGTKLSRSEYNALCLQGVDTYGSIAKGIALHHHIDDLRFLRDLVPLIDLTELPTTSPVHGQIEKHSHVPMCILTSALKSWTSRVLGHLNLAPYFPMGSIIDAEDTNGILKSMGPEPFQIAAQTIGLKPDALIMVDDVQRNLVFAKVLGMTTFWVTDGATTRPAHVDYIVPDASYIFRELQDYE